MKRYTIAWVAIAFAGVLAPLVALSILVERAVKGRLIAPAVLWCGKRWQVVMREYQRWQP